MRVPEKGGYVMSTDERKAWLASLMPGDEVVVCHGWDETFIKTTKVERITPSGHIVAGNREYDPEHGVDTGRTKGVPRMLRPLPDSMKDADERKALATRFRAVDWESLPVEQLRAIAALVDQKESSNG